MPGADELTTVLEPRPLPNFVETPFVKDITERALAYIASGFPIHFRGATGTGKTTLALHVASIIGRPVVMVHGDEEFTTSDLIGGEYGYRIKKTVDNFIHSVLKTEEDMTRRWQDNRLTIACKYGFTLLYDEFTRSRPEANNTLLSVLQEKMLDLPSSRQAGESYLRVDPDFTAIFTSNPEEYAGTFRSQDALRDRMITIDLNFFDRETEVAITAAKSGADPREAEKIVDIVRALRETRETEMAPTIRACIMIAKAIRVRGVPVSASDRVFRATCHDILISETSRGDRDSQSRVKGLVDVLIDQAFAKPEKKPAVAKPKKVAVAKEAVEVA